MTLYRNHISLTWGKQATIEATSRTQDPFLHLFIWYLFIVAPTMYRVSIYLAAAVLGAGDTVMIPTQPCLLV